MSDSSSKELTQEEQDQAKQLAVNLAKTALAKMDAFEPMYEAYKEVEWSIEYVAGGVTYNICPLCQNAQGKGHLSSCLFVAANEKLVAVRKIIEETKDLMDKMPKEKQDGQEDD